MCNCCNPDSEYNEIWQDSLTGDWYLDIRTGEWDEYDDDYVHQREYINYCPWCGRDLYNYRSCSTCKFASTIDANRPLYKCLNTEMVLSSSTTDKFYCSKWEKKDLAEKQLSDKFNYCSALEILPVDKDEQLHYNGYKVKCGVYDFIIETPGDCSTCKLKEDK